MRLLLGLLMLATIKSWLGFADNPQSEIRTPQLEEFGVTGTPFFGGFISDPGEYNANLAGLSAYRTYEKMRRGDGQVAATLLGMKLPIRSAEWTVIAPEDATPVEEEAAEFVKQELLESLELDAVVDNALLMLDFGASAHEDVYVVDGNRIRLKKLAARPPITFNRWLTAPGTDELVEIEQQGWRGEGYITAHVPVSKISLFTFNQEGANYAGRSVMRPMYPHWFIKSKLYAIDAIAQERNGMGVPVLKMPPNVSAEDRKTGKAWIEKLSVHEKLGILLPPEWDFDLKGVTGTVRNAKDSIAHHNMQISMAGLAQFMLLGQKDSGGNRALGQTMGDMFLMSLQATANKVARVMRQTTIKRLVDFNFAGVERYPQLVPQQILSIDFTALVTALKDLAASNLVEADDDLEAWLRKKTGAPEKGRPRPRPAAPVQTSAENKTAEIAETADTEEEEQEIQGSAVSAFSAVKTSRPPRGAELYLALDAMVNELDRGRDEIAAALRSAKKRVQAEIVNKLVNAPVRTLHRVSVAPDEKLVADVERVLEEVSEFGYEQVHEERARQLTGAPPQSAPEIRALADRKKRGKRDPLGVYADGAVSEFTNNLTARAANVVLDLKRGAGRAGRSAGEVILDAERRLDEQSDKWIDGIGSKAANNAFADGRADAAGELADEIAEVQYSALLDGNTCEVCSAADGQGGKTEADVPPVPNPNCLGGDKCRCVHVYVFADEKRSAA